MPIYEFVCYSLDCPKHNHEIEKMCRFDDISHQTCDLCRKTLHKIASATPGHVKNPAVPKR